MTQDTSDTLQKALEAGWVNIGSKVTSDGKVLTGLLLETTGEVLWFDDPHLNVTFK